ncbi:nucleoside phosphorylase [Candidatus Woesearchaeota archaeon]|nr:nucleoside phosphorylase [Candidatus Woesearchaeota archaeon]
MTYPNFKNKHLEKALINPESFTSWEKFKHLKIKNKPNKFIFIYYPYILNYFRRKYKPTKLKLYRLLTIYQYKNIGLIPLTGIGSPNAVVVFEEIFALGGKEYINIGSAGGLDGFGTFLCEAAVRDEGTSYHYEAHGKLSYPDEKLTEKFGEYIKKQGLNFKKTKTWTVDAPYRETINELHHYKKLGVKTVEMEASALFTVAKFRKVKMAAAFVVSDLLLPDKWNPAFDSKHVKQDLKKLLDAAVECLIN